MTTSARSRHLFAITMAVGGLATLVGAPAMAASGDDPHRYPSALLCESGRGCKHSPLSGMEQRWFWETLLGTEAPESNTVVCIGDGGCSWSALDDEEADISFGGDGAPDGQRGMVFDEDEGMVFGEDEGMVVESPGTQRPMVFTEDEVASTIDVTPMSGRWTSTHAAGVMDCGVMRLDIPAGDTGTGEMIVADDGASFVTSELSADTETLEMFHVSGGVYHADITVTADGREMVLNFDVVFVDPGLGQGLIWAEFADSGVTCRIDRPFVTIHEQIEFFPNA